MRRYPIAALLVVFGVVSLAVNAVEAVARPPSVVSVLDFGAVGDGVADDTEAIQKALNGSTAEVVFPAGTYRVTKTLFLGLPRPTTSFSYRRHFRGEGVEQSFLAWDGEAGGTLFHARSMLSCKFSSLSFIGHPGAKSGKVTTGRAGILFQCEFTGGGNMLNCFDSCRFNNADVGIKMGIKEGEGTNSDVLFSNIMASQVGTFFWAANNQAVDFTFNFLFIVDAGTVFRFQRGGNLLVNSVQVTDADTVLRIEGGGRCAATYVLNNARLEGGTAGLRKRLQLLSAPDIAWEQALVRFIGFNDAQWQWYANAGESRRRPLCDIGPGVNVAFDSSAFNGPVATVTGREGKPASVVIRESTFGYLTPAEAITANPFGYFKTENCFTDNMAPYPDVVKWPALPRQMIAGDADFETPLPGPVKTSVEAGDNHQKRQAAWVQSLEPEQEPGAASR